MSGLLSSSVAKADTLKEHNYFRAPTSGGTTLMRPSRPGSVTLTMCNDTSGDVIASLLSRPNGDPKVQQKQRHPAKKCKSLRPGSKVQILVGERVIAKGATMAGDVLHGHKVPEGFRKVIVEEVFDLNVKLQVPNHLDDEQFLCPNTITAWRDTCMRLCS